MSEGIKGKITSFIKSTFGVAEDVDLNISLTGTGIVSSISMIEMICWVEETFNLSIPPEDFLPEYFDTVNSIYNYIKSKRA